MKSFLLLLSVLILTACSGNVPSGHVGIFIKSPILLGDNGIDPQVAAAGRHYYAFWSTELFFYNIQPQSITEKFDDLVTKDTIPVDFDAFITIAVIPEKAPILHEKFGIKWYENNLERQFQEIVRMNAKKHEAFSLMNNAEVSEEVSKAVLEKVREYVVQIKLPIEVTNVTIGKINPPEPVIRQVVETAAQEQKQKTEVQRANAELARAGAEKNKALADRAYREASGMSIKEYLMMRNIEIELAKVNMAKEKANVTVIMGTVTPVMDVGSNK